MDFVCAVVVMQQLRPAGYVNIIRFYSLLKGYF